jgi:hypothetical protein
MPLAYFVVRATVADPAKRKAFDEWYKNEHLPDAAKAFGVSKAHGSGAFRIPRCTWRCMSSPIQPRSIGP